MQERKEIQMKETKLSDKPCEYFFKLMNKRARRKRLGQKDRMFMELFMNKTLECYYFSQQMSPKIIGHTSRISELRNMGFVIPSPTIKWVKGQKHSTYSMSKTEIYVEKKTWFGKLKEIITRKNV